MITQNSKPSNVSQTIPWQYLPMSAAKPILYGFWRSSCAWRVRLALNYKKIPFEHRCVDLFNGKHKSAEYTTINHFAMVPSLVLPPNSEWNPSGAQPIVLSESLAMLEFIEEMSPESAPSIFPQDPIQRAQARAHALAVAADIQPYGQIRVLDYVDKTMHSDKKSWVRHWITEGFVALERNVATTSGKYSVNDSISIADICLVPQIFNARLWEVDMTQFPTLSRIDATLSEHPAFIASHPYAQPDAPKQKSS